MDYLLAVIGVVAIALPIFMLVGAIERCSKNLAELVRVLKAIYKYGIK